MRIEPGCVWLGKPCCPLPKAVALGVSVAGFHGSAQAGAKAMRVERCLGDITASSPFTAGLRKQDPRGSALSPRCVPVTRAEGVSASCLVLGRAPRLLASSCLSLSAPPGMVMSFPFSRWGH